MAVEKVVWEEPPAPARGRGGSESVRHYEVAAELRSAPKEWGRIGDYSKATTAANIATQIGSGKLRAYLPAGAYEACARTMADKHFVYARYVGEAGDDE